jgi:hypothetical protein
MSAERVPASMQRRVRERAAERCEYCGIAQAQQEATFHLDHASVRRRPAERRGGDVVRPAP